MQHITRLQHLAEAILPTRLLRKLYGEPTLVPAAPVQAAAQHKMSKEDVRLLASHGITSGILQDLIQKSTQMGSDRLNLYRELERSLQHAMMTGAAGTYTDIVTTYNRIHGATVWPSSKDNIYRNRIQEMLTRIGAEERVYDWANNTGTFGDHFVRVYGEPGVGVTHIDDNYSPSQVIRVDYNGRLVGFFESRDGQTPDIKSTFSLLPPWTFIHFRVLGAVRRRHQTFGAPYMSDFSTIDMTSGDRNKISVRYGNSLLQEALPIYKRLRLAEDTLLMARISKSLLRYIWKIKVPQGMPTDAANEVITQYESVLRRSVAMNLDSGDPNYEARLNDMSVNEDGIIPVFGDVGDITVEKMGGETDIRGIRDIEELKLQLSMALRMPLSMLGDTSQEPGSIGENSLERVDIRTARHARRLQRAVIVGFQRLAQIDLAYHMMNPSENLFKIHMSETSTAEEEEIKNALQSGVNAVDALFDFVIKAIGEERMAPNAKVDLAKYLQSKFLSLGDLDLDELVSRVERKADQKTPETPRPLLEPTAPQPGQAPPEPEVSAVTEVPKTAEPEGAPSPSRESLDLRAALPAFTNKGGVINECRDDHWWYKKWGSTKLKLSESALKSIEKDIRIRKLWAQKGMA